jgi:hypothetical protein
VQVERFLYTVLLVVVLALVMGGGGGGGGCGGTGAVRHWPNCPASHNDISETTIATSCNGNLKSVSQMNQDSSVCIVTKVQTGCQKKVVKISSAKRPDGLYGPHRLL